MKKEFLTTAFVLMFSVTGQKAQEALNNDLKKENFESEYYYAFTEATRHMIYQNFPQAVSLYQRCLEYNPNSAAIHYQLSVIYFRMGNVTLAKTLGKEACGIDPGNRWYLIHLIKIYQTSNQIDSAILYNNLLIEVEPENVENLLNLGILYQIRGDHRRALDLYDAMEEDYGKNNEIYINKYKIYMRSGKRKMALKQLESAKEMTPDDTDIIGMIAEHYRDIGDKDKADQYYQLLFKSSDENSMAVFSFIQHLLRFRKYNDAFEFYKNAVNQNNVQKEQVFAFLMNEIESSIKDPMYFGFLDTAMGFSLDKFRDDIRIKGLYVDYQFKRSGFDRASAMLKEILNGNERNYRIWEQILYAENALNRYDSVLLYGERVIETFDRESVPYLYTGIAYQQLKQKDKAMRMLEKGLQLSNNKNLMLQYYVILADAYHDSGEEDRAFDYYEKALSIDGGNIIVMNNYAYFLALADKELEKAEKMSRYTVEKEKRNYIYLDTYAWIMYKMKKMNMARKYIRKAMKYGGEKSTEVMDHYRIILGK